MGGGGVWQREEVPQMLLLQISSSKCFCSVTPASSLLVFHPPWQLQARTALVGQGASLYPDSNTLENSFHP
jgi:hypothetical protein